MRTSKRKKVGVSREHAFCRLYAASVTEYASLRTAIADNCYARGLRLRDRCIVFRIVRSSCPRLLGYWLIFNVFRAFLRSIGTIYRSADSINFETNAFLPVGFLPCNIDARRSGGLLFRFGTHLSQLVKRSVLLTAPCLQHLK